MLELKVAIGRRPRWQNKKKTQVRRGIAFTWRKVGPIKRWGFLVTPLHRPHSFWALLHKIATVDLKVVGRYTRDKGGIKRN